MVLSIANGHIHGRGSDKDGRFEVAGFFQANSQKLTLTRHYTWTTEPSQAGAGIMYEYVGDWDGDLAFGTWHPFISPSYGGQFEMWPEREEDQIERALEIQVSQPLARV